MPSGPTALILPVPDAESAVGTWRARFDKHAAQGVPAHITLLSPFLHLSAARAAWPQVRRIVQTRAPRFTFSGLTRWDGLAVLCPQPDAWFLRVSRTLCGRFGLLPYGGRYGAAVHPHLTVAYGADIASITRARFDAIERDLARRLPLRCVGSQVLLMARDGARWRTVEVAELVRAPRPSFPEDSQAR